MSSDQAAAAPSTPKLGPAQVAESYLIAFQAWSRVADMELDLKAAHAAVMGRRGIPRSGGAAEVDGDLWRTWVMLSDAIADLTALAELAEADLRDQLGIAAAATVAGRKVATRVVFSTPVKPFDWKQDILRRAPAARDSRRDT